MKRCDEMCKSLASLVESHSSHCDRSEHTNHQPQTRPLGVECHVGRVLVAAFCCSLLVRFTQLDVTIESFLLLTHSSVMSAATPAASTPDGTTPANAGLPTSEGSIGATDRTILEYLRSKGYKGAEKEFLAALEGNSSDEKGKKPDTSGDTSSIITQEELTRAEAVSAHRLSRTGGNALKEHTSVIQELASMGTPANIQNLISSIDAVGAEEILSLDPSDKQEGFRELEAWVDGSLDMYRVSVYVPGQWTYHNFNAA